MIPCNEPERIFRSACKFYEKCVNAYGIDNVVLLNPYRSKTELSVDAFNFELQARLNPLAPGALSIKSHGIEFRDNDRIMQTKNTDCAKNGDVGYVRRICRKPSEDDPTEWAYYAEVEFNGSGEVIQYSEEALKNVDLAYCNTVHKSQGSQYETVIMVLSNLHRMLLKRNLVYTAVTRAETNVALVGEVDALNKAIQNNKADVRYTLLASRLQAG